MNFPPSSTNCIHRNEIVRERKVNESMEVGWKPQIVSNNTVDWMYPYKGAHDQYTLTYISSMRTFAHRYYLIWIASNLLDIRCDLNNLFVVLAVKKIVYVVFAIRPAQSLTKTAGVGDSKLYCTLWWMESDEVKSPQNTKYQCDDDEPNERR